MDSTLHILHLEDDPLDTELVREQLEENGFQVEIDRVDSLPALKSALERKSYTLILSDYSIPGTDPLESLQLIREQHPELPIIFLSGTIGEDLATQTLKLGANDYVLKQRMQRLGPTVRRALTEAQELARRKQAEDALRRSEERLRLAQEVARIGSFEWNLLTNVIEWSPELESLYGLPAGTFDRTIDGWRQRIHPDDQDSAWRRKQQAIETGTLDAEWRTRWPDGTIRWLSARGHVFKDESGRPLRMVGVNIDITDRKRDEETLRAAKRSAEAAREAAEEASRAKDHFLAILSHELRTPLTAVLPALDILRDVAPAQVKEYVEMASRNVQLEARLIDDLLDVTRIARGKIELQRQPIDLCTVVRRAADVCKPDMEIREIHFAMRFDGPPHMVDGDPTRLEQVFWNLIKNAVKFTPPNGCIGIRVQRVDDYSVTEVIDSGAGIDREAISRIFNAFEQEAKSTTRQFGGLGLGLAICKALVEMHGGTIRAHSEGKGKGASFITRFPLIHTEPNQPMLRQVEPKPASTDHLRILLVEDHADTARILSVLLRKAGHQVQHAADVATGFQLAQTETFDVLISDLGLPDGSGHDLMRQLIATGHPLPGIALSGYGTASDIERSHAAGFRDHITKPVTFPTLLAALSRLTTEVKR